MQSAHDPHPSPAAAAAPRAWEQVLDREALDRLRELDPGGRGGLVDRVLATYAQSLAKLLDQLAAARAAADHGGLRHVSHTLKSSSASVGALQLSALCADIERRVREGQTDGLDERLDAMAAEGRRVLAALSPNPMPTA
jgi:HPt (histidine-containing phosphotransfer) domain-containing protein